MPLYATLFSAYYISSRSTPNPTSSSLEALSFGRHSLALNSKFYLIYSLIHSSSQHNVLKTIYCTKDIKLNQTKFLSLKYQNLLRKTCLNISIIKVDVQDFCFTREGLDSYLYTGVKCSLPASSPVL